MKLKPPGQMTKADRAVYAKRKAEIGKRMRANAKATRDLIKRAGTIGLELHAVNTAIVGFDALPKAPKGRALGAAPKGRAGKRAPKGRAHRTAPLHT